MPIRAKSRRTRAHLIDDLRKTIDCLPVRTRQAMLEAVWNERIIVGAYVDREGGVCPMMAAHRRGGRTDFLSFAKSWDRYTGAGRRSRRATEPELRVLVAHLEASLIEESGLDLQGAINDHRQLRAKRERSPSYAREADPTGRILLRRLTQRPLQRI
jgi:hypothetical protein